MRTRAFTLLVAAVAIVVPAPAAGAAPPANDHVSSATEVASAPFGVTQDTRAATRAADDPATGGRDCFGDETHTVWFRFSAPETATFALDTAGSDYDTTLAVYRGSPGALSLEECSAYFGGTMQGRILLKAAAGDAFFVMVAASDGSPSAGTLSLTIEESPVEPLELDLEPRAGLLDNGEVELSGRVSCSRPATVGLDGAVEQGPTYGYFFPPSFSCSPRPRRFRAPTREREGPGFTPGPATALVIAYGFDEHDRDVPEVEVKVDVAAGRIVYARSTGGGDAPRRTELFVMDPDGSDVVQLTDNRVEDTFPAMSPDGRYVAFSRSGRGGHDLYVVRSNGRRAVRIAAGPAGEVLPAWSPDGQWLAYSVTSDTEDGWQSDLFKVRLADGRVVRLTDTARAKEYAVEWSPDGSALAFTRDVPRGGQGIGTLPARGGAVEWLVRNPLRRSGYSDYGPTWSPDGAWVAFSREHGDGEPFVDVFKVRRDGSEVTAVTDLGELTQLPAWGTDGRIAFHYRGGLAVVSADGGGLQVIGETGTRRPYHWSDW